MVNLSPFRKKDPTLTRRHRVESGVDLRGFGSQHAMTIHNLFTPDNSLTSMEEWPPASSEQGGNGAFIWPTDSGDQSSTFIVGQDRMKYLLT